MSMAKGLLSDLHPQCAVRPLDRFERPRRRMLIARAQLAAVARKARAGRSAEKFIQIDIEPKEMVRTRDRDSRGRRHRLLRLGAA